MTISSSAKVGAAGIVSSSVPITVYFANDHIFLYEIERDVINGEDKLTIGSPEGGTTTEGNSEVVIKISVSSNKWSCIITAKLAPGHESGTTLDATSDKTKLENYIKKRVPTNDSASGSSSAEITEIVKQKNKKKLVWDCSGNRTSVTDTSIATKLLIHLNKNNGKLSTSLFGPEEEAENS